MSQKEPRIVVDFNPDIELIGKGIIIVIAMILFTTIIHKLIDKASEPNVLRSGQIEHIFNTKNYLIASDSTISIFNANENRILETIKTK